MTESFATLTEYDITHIAQRVAYLLFNEPYYEGDPSKVILGDNVVLNGVLFNTQSGMVVVGDNCFFGHNVSLVTCAYAISKRGSARQKNIQTNCDIFIGEGVFIASGAIIVGPCSIGEHAVIAAGAVVTSGELAGGCLYAGNPAKFIKALVLTD